MSSSSPRPASARLTELERKLQDYINELYEEDDEDLDDSRKQAATDERKKTYFMGILSDICDVIRGATAATDYQDLLFRADKLLNAAVSHVHEESKEKSYMRSFAHSEVNPEVVVSSQETFESILAAAEKALGRSPPWVDSPKPHPSSSRLSRFKPDITVSATSATPTANFIYQARSEITEDSICCPIDIKLSSDGACLAISTTGGWKQNRPFVQYHLLDDKSDFHKSYSIDVGLDDPARHMAIDESRKLIFVADDERVKSFAWGVRGGKDYGDALPTHTMHSNSDSGSWDGPIALLSDEYLIRAGKGSVAVWHLDSLETHGRTGKAPIEETYSDDEEAYSDDDEEEPFVDEVDEENEVESSYGSKATERIRFENATLHPAVWGAHPSVVGSMICGFSWKDPLGSSCIVVDLEHGGKMVTRYLGHGGEVLVVSTSAADPNVFVTGCSDGYARLFDVRQPLPAMTFDAGQRGEECRAAVLAYPDGIPSLFTGAARKEEVRLWDIRAKTTVYELSTGNTAVASLAWDERRNALYAATECRYMDRMGSWYDYRRAKVPKDQRYGYSAGGDMDVEEDEDEGGYEDDDDDDDDERCWPKKAYRGEDYFGYLYDAGDHKIFRYAFKEDPDMTFLPPYGQATIDGGSYW